VIPSWFAAALEHPRREGTVDVGGCPIHYLDWGDVHAPGLVFVHGGAAHAHWWSFLAPLFTYRWRVVAFDLSGHGDSGRRPAYSLALWAQEAASVVRRAAFPAPPVVAGHSLGGLVAIQTAHHHCPELAGVVLVDAPVYRPDPAGSGPRRSRAFHSPGTYPTLDEALEHFRLVPEQPMVPPFVFDHVARTSLHRSPEGWTWKFDPAAFRQSRPDMSEQLAAVRCRLALIYGERSEVLTPDTTAYMSELTGGRMPIIPIVEAHHHLVLDQPLAFVAALRTLLTSWEEAAPHPAG